MEGKTVEFAKKEINKFYNLVQGKDGDYESLGDANSLAGVASFPARIRCATISWKALEMVLEGDLDEEREI
jgi:nitrogen fixation NifU-like protein